MTALNTTQLTDELFAEAMELINLFEGQADGMTGGDESEMQAAVIEVAARRWWNVVDSFNGAIELGRSDRAGFGLIVETDGSIIICDPFGNRF